MELKNLKIKIAQKLIALNLLSTKELAAIVELEIGEIEQLHEQVYDKAENEFQEKLQALCLGLNVEQLSTHIMAKEVESLSQANDTVSFFEAFQAAIYNILTDNTTSRSLIEHILDKPEQLGLGEHPSKLSIYTAIQELLKQPSSKMSMLSATPTNAPKRGETIADSWIFVLDIPNFLEQSHWAIVPRNGNRVYNYSM